MTINTNRFMVKNGLDNNSKTITNVADPVNAQDAATRAYVLANAGGSIALTDDTATNSAHYLTLTSSTSGTLNTIKVSSSKLSFNPSTGNLGIGTNTLNQALCIGGAGRLIKLSYYSNDRGMYLYQGSGYGSNLTNNLYIDGTGSAVASYATGGAFNIADNGEIVFSNFSGATVGSAPTITERMRINTLGNIGIGTNNPDSLSPVFGSLSRLGAYNSAGIASITAKGTGNPNWFSVLSLVSDETTDKEWYIGHSNTNIGGINSLAFSYYNGTTSSIPLLITSNGNVGIGGTPSATYKLDVIGNSATIVSGRVYNADTSSTSNASMTVQNGVGTTAVLQAYNNIALVNVTSAHTLEFRTSNATRGVFHATTGEFSIGNSAPVTGQGRLQTFDTLAGGAVASARFINTSGTAGSAVALSLDPGNNGFNTRDGQIRAVNNGSNQITMEFYTSNAATPVKALSINAGGAFGLGSGASYGTTGQVLTSQGSGASPIWAAAASGGLTLAAADSVSTYAIPMSASVSGTWTTAAVDNADLYYSASTSTLYCTNFNSASDERLKSNISTINNSLETVNQLRGVEFTWNSNGKKSYGVIAQELEKILPDVVDTIDDQKSVNYTSLIGFLIEAVKELSAEVSKLKGE